LGSISASDFAGPGLRYLGSEQEEATMAKTSLKKQIKKLTEEERNELRYSVKTLQECISYASGCLEDFCDIFEETNFDEEETEKDGKSVE
jgi:hypothetical protein